MSTRENIRIIARASLKTLASIGAEKSATEMFIGEKKNEQIKGLISNVWLFFCFVTQYNSSLSSIIPNFRTLSQVVVEKSLTEFIFTNRQT